MITPDGKAGRRCWSAPTTNNQPQCLRRHVLYLKYARTERATEPFGDLNKERKEMETLPTHGRQSDPAAPLLQNHGTIPIAHRPTQRLHRPKRRERANSLASNTNSNNVHRPASLFVFPLAANRLRSTKHRVIVRATFGAPEQRGGTTHHEHSDGAEDGLVDRHEEQDAHAALDVFLRPQAECKSPTQEHVQRWVSAPQA